MTRRQRVVIGGIAVIAAAIGLLAAPAVLAAQAPRPNLASDPAAVAVHERHLKAIGTATLPEFSRTVWEMQTGFGPAMRTEILTARPDRVRMTQTMGGQVVMEFGFDGTTGWTSSPLTGVVTLEGPELESMRANFSAVDVPVFDSVARLVALGRSTLEDEAVDGILTITADGDTVEAFYSVSTGLLAGIRMRGEPGSPLANATMLFRDYKRTAGRMTHTTMVIRTAGQELTTKIISADESPIAIERFRPPSPARAP